MRKRIARRLLPYMLGLVCNGQDWWTGLKPQAEQTEHLGPGRITVRVFNLSTAPAGVMRLAIAEAERVLAPLGLPIDCMICSKPVDVQCSLPETPVEVLIRILPKALPHVSRKALGMTSRSSSGASAAVFYDRALSASLRKTGTFPGQVLGRAMAHEVIHVLSPIDGHLSRGLMRAPLTPDDLRLGCLECTLLSDDLVDLIRNEVRHRTELAGIGTRRSWPPIEPH